MASEITDFLAEAQTAMNEREVGFPVSGGKDLLRRAVEIIQRQEEQISYVTAERDERDGAVRIGNKVLERVGANYDRLREALEDIADPISRLRDAAELAGMEFDGMMAVRMADDAGYLQNIARAALAAGKEDEGE